MSWIEIIACRKVEQAIQAGEFDDLSGKGQPLILDYDPRVPVELRAAYRLMKEAGVQPEWIVMEKQLRLKMAAWRRARVEFVAEWKAEQPRANADATRARALDAQRDCFLIRAVETMQALNQMIDRFNLHVPMPSRQRIRYRVEDEMRALAAAISRRTPATEPEPWRKAYKKKAAAPSRLCNHYYVRRRETR